MKIMNQKERIDRWDWIKGRWSMKQMDKVVNSLVKSGLVKNRIGKYALNENSLIAHQCLTNLIILRLTDEEYRHKLGIGKLTASEKRLLQQIMLNYKLLYDTFHTGGNRISMNHEFYTGEKT